MSAAEVEEVEAEEEDFSSLSKKELAELAEERGLEVPKKASKSKILSLLNGGSEERPPVIRTGDWVRLASGEGVPDHLANRDAVVLRALVKRAEGGDVFSSVPYEFQDGSEMFLVRVRDTGTELELSREAFRAHGTQQVELGVA